LSSLGKIYLDHAGTTLYARSLIEEFSRKMLENLYGNPHSASKPATVSGDMVDEVRRKALLFFGADPEYYDLVFVSNTTAAIKMVKDSFQDLASVTTSGFRYCYHRDAHTSIVGVREATTDHMCFQNDDEVELWLEGSGGTSHKMDRPCLFAYPGQSNMTGRRLPLSWSGRLRNSSLPIHQNSYSLLDAAALSTTSSLAKVFQDPQLAPDFTSLSFYKIFGFPDLGALIVSFTMAKILWGWNYYYGDGFGRSLVSK